MGCAALQIENWNTAVTAFRRCIGINDEVCIPVILYVYSFEMSLDMYRMPIFVDVFRMANRGIILAQRT